MRALLLAVLLLAPLALAGNAYDNVQGGDATGWNTQRKVARAADGSAYWTYLAPAQDGTRSEVVVVRERPDGALDEVARPRAARGDASRSSIALDAQGRLHVAWTERADDDREVFAALLQPNGRLGDATQLSGGLGYAGFPSLAVDAAGGVHAAWYGFDGTVYQAFYRAMLDGVWQPSVQLSSGTLDANNPSALVDANGSVHVVWYKDDGRAYRIWHAVRHEGEPFALPRAVPSATDALADAFNAALAMDASGRVHLVWDEKHVDGYWVVHSTWSRGKGWAPPDVLARGDQGGEYPAIARWRDTVLVAWTDANATLVGTALDGAPRPLLGGVLARNPSLRGPMPVPESEQAPMLDLLYATPVQGAGSGWRVEHAALPEDACSPFEPLAACAGATIASVDVARPPSSPGVDEPRAKVAAPAWAAVLLAGGLAAIAMAAHRRR